MRSAAAGVSSEAWFNGQELTQQRPGRKVLEADDTRGFIVSFARDAEGALFHGPDGKLQRETLFGDVRIVVLSKETS